MDMYLTVLGESTSEYEEKRSRFIATLRHCKTEQDAMAFIEEMRSKYWDARHNVFAYCVEGGTLSRFSDDGEPHGTAGKPILDVINGNNLKDIAIVVTRYFGGTLLGTGGLVRAYSKASRDAVENSVISQMIPCTVFKTVCEYSDHQKLINLIENSGGMVDSTDFTDKITIKYTFRDEMIKVYLLKLSEIFSARIIAEILENKVLPYPLKK